MKTALDASCRDSACNLGNDCLKGANQKEGEKNLPNLDMGGHVVPGSAYVDPDSEPGEWFVFADVHDCNAYPDEVITWSIATSPHFEIALLIANSVYVEKFAEEGCCHGSAFGCRSESPLHVALSGRIQTTAFI